MLKLIGDYMCNEIIKRENKNWSAKEDIILLNNYKQLGYSEVAKLVSRSSSSCRTRLYRLRKNNKTLKSQYQMFNEKWTASQDDFLKANYPDKGAEWCSKHLNRSPSSCISRAGKLKIKRSYRWSKDEDDIIKKYYPIIGKFVSEIIKTKNEKACSQKATRLKITYTKDDSSAVEKIKSYLNSQKIVYRQEVGLEGCVDKNPLLFDFAIYEDNNLKKLIGIIEYDGSQHFLPTTLYSDKKINAKEVLERTQRHDQIKNRYCQKNKIPKLRIKYCQNNIEKLVAEFLKHREKYIEWYNQEYSFEKYYSEIEDEELKKYFIHFSKYKNKGTKNINPNFCISKWSQEDDLFLEKYYPDNGSAWVSKRLHKTQQACISHANKLGLVRSNHWKREEDAFVLKHYLSKGPLWISKKLKRTKNSIEHRAHRLGAEKRIKYWTKEEDQILLSNWDIKSEKELSEIIGRTKMSIGNRKKILRKYRTKEASS